MCKIIICDDESEIRNDLRHFTVDMPELNGLDAIKVIKDALISYEKEKKIPADDLTCENLDLVDSSINYIYKNHNNPKLSLKNMASHLYVSESYLTRIIKKKANTSFSKLLTKVRIEEAIVLMLSNNVFTNLEISEKVGYKSQHYFCRVFKKYTGMTPTAYKKSHAIQTLAPQKTNTITYI